MLIRLGTRGSRLALWQAGFVSELLGRCGVDVEIVVVKTRGDVQQSGSIANIGATGVFTKEIQSELLDGRFDLAVHSLKDLPTDIVHGLRLAATPIRGAVRDAFVSRKFTDVGSMPDGSVIGTGSLRRKTQLIFRYGNRFNIVDIRGNIETRLKRLNDGDYDAVILAEAGLVRLGYADVIRSLLEPPEFLPAVAQGAIGIEIREDDTTTANIIAAINDAPTFAAVTAERAFLRKLQGGCIAPIAAIGNVDDSRKLRLSGRILTVDGGRMLEGDLVGETENAEGLGIALAEILLGRGADEIVKEIRGEFNRH